MRIILGSQSPRRQEILSYFRLPFEQKVSGFDEEAVAYSGDPIDHVERLARGKGEALAAQFPGQVILTADTIVFLETTIFGKPKDVADAVRMLHTLGGRWHTVATAVTVTADGQQWTEVEQSRVHLRRLTDPQLKKYIVHHNTLDKAGSYAIQGSGSLLVDAIEGSFYNVMGLPLQPVARLLHHKGIDLWDYLA